MEGSGAPDDDARPDASGPPPFGPPPGASAGPPGFGPPPAPPPAPPPVPPVGPPTAAGPPDHRRGRLRRRIIVGSGVPILIGLITLAGAGLTWRSLDLGGQAADADRRAVLDTIAQQRARLYAESQVRYESQQFARYRATRVAADEFRRAGEEAADQGDSDQAAGLARTAESLTAQADTRLATVAALGQYVSGEGTPDLAFDAKRRRLDLERQNPYFEAASVDPGFTRREADDLHDRSLVLVAFIVALTGVGALLTVAEFMSGRTRVALAGVGAFAGVAITMAALLGPGY